MLISNRGSRMNILWSWAHLHCKKVHCHCNPTHLQNSSTTENKCIFSEQHLTGFRCNSLISYKHTIFFCKNVQELYILQQVQPLIKLHLHHKRAPLGWRFKHSNIKQNSIIRFFVTQTHRSSTVPRWSSSCWIRSEWFSQTLCFLCGWTTTQSFTFK